MEAKDTARVQRSGRRQVSTPLLSLGNSRGKKGGSIPRK
jgi:hypothetical protein